VVGVTEHLRVHMLGRHDFGVATGNIGEDSRFSA
jgi:hypothetical protein